MGGFFCCSIMQEGLSLSLVGWTLSSQLVGASMWCCSICNDAQLASLAFISCLLERLIGPAGQKNGNNGRRERESESRGLPIRVQYSSVHHLLCCWWHIIRYTYSYYVMRLCWDVQDAFTLSHETMWCHDSLDNFNNGSRQIHVGGSRREVGWGLVWVEWFFLKVLMCMILMS